MATSITDVGRVHTPPRLTYVVPLRAWEFGTLGTLPTYLAALPEAVEIIVVDGSEPNIFATHGSQLPGRVRHVSIQPGTLTRNGKVGGVATGIALARADKIVLADDDVRYDEASLVALEERLERADLVRPQNYFAPLPWHAHWDTARTLLNRTTGGDWPGTLGVRKASFLAAGGYSGDVLFENYELSCAIRRSGGVEDVAYDVYVRRIPPHVHRFFEQRVRQAYDEFARPIRLVVALLIIPFLVVACLLRRWLWLGTFATGAVALAEVGRRRRGGARYFSTLSSLFAPLWLIERGFCSWMALIRRYRDGGIKYAGCLMRRSAT